MPVNVAMEEPRSRVVSRETECNIVGACSNADDITADRVSIVVHRTTSTANDGEGVLITKI